MEPHLPPDPLSGAAGFAAPPDGPSARARDEARLGLYVHVPFCAVRCAYCDFSSGRLSAAAVERWMRALERECELRAPTAAGAHFTSVFFGGGTPSAIPSHRFARVWRTLTEHFAIAPGAEVTLEANPESVKPSLLEAWAAAGVNRLSMGAQSFDPAELQALGRIHGPERPAEAFALARAHGFRRLSLDLMFGFPSHDAATWEATLDRALALEPEHLSAYAFIPEAGTPLGDAVIGGSARLPDDDRQADLYESLVRRAGETGLAPYETSNFARAGGECRHNLVYWLRREYLGLGPSAHGLWHGRRYANAYALERWAGALEADRDCDTVEQESASSRADETVMLGLRLGTGVDFRDLPAPARTELEARYGAAFAAAVAAGRLERTAGGVRIPPALRFVADDVIAWTMARARPLADAPRMAAIPEVMSRPPAAPVAASPAATVAAPAAAGI